jgi:hypothetical protein
MFQILIRLDRAAMLELSVPEMVDMIDYYQEVRGGG